MLEWDAFFRWFVQYRRNVNIASISCLFKDSVAYFRSSLLCFEIKAMNYVYVSNVAFIGETFLKVKPDFQFLERAKSHLPVCDRTLNNLFLLQVRGL